MDLEIALERLSAYIERELPLPSKSWPEHRFKERSYARWAAYEIFERIAFWTVGRLPMWLTEKIGPEPLTIVCDFIDEVDSVYEDSFLLTAEWICRVAKETAEDIREMYIKDYP